MKIATNPKEGMNDFHPQPPTYAEMVNTIKKLRKRVPHSMIASFVVELHKAASAERHARAVWLRLCHLALKPFLTLQGRHTSLPHSPSGQLCRINQASILGKCRPADRRSADLCLHLQTCNHPLSTYMYPYLSSA